MSRLVSTVALALAMTAQVSTLVHMGAVRHETCEEHGELVEAPPRASDGHELPEGGASEDHDHCLLAATPSLSSMAPSIAHVVTVVSMHDVAAPAPRIVAATLLRSAPKTSPPIA